MTSKHTSIRAITFFIYALTQYSTSLSSSEFSSKNPKIISPDTTDMPLLESTFLSSDQKTDTARNSLLSEFFAEYPAAKNEYLISLPIGQRRLRCLVPRTDAELYGLKTYISAYTITEGAERWERHHEFLTNIRNFTSFASWAQIAAFLIIYDARHDVSAGTTAWAVGLNSLGKAISTQLFGYSLQATIGAHLDRQHERHADALISKVQPTTEMFDPFIICLSRQYAHENLKKTVQDIRDNRHWYQYIFCWPCCRRAGRFLGRPLQGTPLLERISAILVASHKSKSARAEEINRAYKNMIDTLYELDENNSSTIIETSGFGSLSNPEMQRYTLVLATIKSNLKACAK